MNKYGLPLSILAMGSLYIFAIPSEPQAVKLLFKLVPMWLMLLYAYQGIKSAQQKERSHGIVLAGLFFCMLGDGLLHWFVVGLTAFLIGHLCYLNAFVRHWRYSLLRAATIVPIALYSGYFAWQLVDALRQDDKTGLIAPVLLYIAVIAAMAWSAIMSGNRYAIAGSLLFLASDTILSWNMFVEDISHSGIWIMTTYYAAQFLIATAIRSLRTRPNLSIHKGSREPNLKTIKGL
ncbi:lysoplasmalogenase [Cohnella panacarvi]|uniref:lysoplasmalogenase n=1 Tax=Cohnella panacarvi TaxID=400776 RepID=UPI00047CA8BF|nr:lysoplasmalogenase [Cohnella panacarvi]